MCDCSWQLHRYFQPKPSAFIKPHILPVLSLSSGNVNNWGQDLGYSTFQGKGFSFIQELIVFVLYWLLLLLWFMFSHLCVDWREEPLHQGVGKCAWKKWVRTYCFFFLLSIWCSWKYLACCIGDLLSFSPGTSQAKKNNPLINQKDFFPPFFSLYPGLRPCILKWSCCVTWSAPVRFSSVICVLHAVIHREDVISYD